MPHPHSHKCRDCEGKFTCTGDIIANYDGWPEAVCVIFPDEREAVCEECLDSLEQARQTEIKRLEATGQLDPTCKTCISVFYPYYRRLWQRPGDAPFAPRHKASDRCRSGKYPHCTCDTCF